MPLLASGGAAGDPLGGDRLLDPLGIGIVGGGPVEVLGTIAFAYWPCSLTYFARRRWERLPGARLKRMFIDSPLAFQ